MGRPAGSKTDANGKSTPSNQFDADPRQLAECVEDVNTTYL